MVKDNQSHNENIKEYLNYYKKLDFPGFAILLKGEWGCGKTHFIKNYFQLEDKENNESFNFKKKYFSLKNNQHKESSKAIYISLYGIRDIESIDILIIQKLIPILADRKVQLTGSVINILLKSSLKIDLKDLKNTKILNEFTNLDNKILIFDDLERCKIDINDLLGYINFFVEHQALKVILIADEDKIEGNIIQSYEAKKFDKIKEKVIGKRFTVNTSFDKAFEQFLNLVCKDKQEKTYLSEKRDFIKELFETGDSNNLRTLKSIIYDFDRIYSYLSEQALSNTDFLDALLKSLTILSIESRLGNLPEDKIKILSDIYGEYSSNIASNYTKINDGVKENYKYKQFFMFCARLQYKYFFSFEYFLPNHLWWGDFFEHGIIDKQALYHTFINSKYYVSQDSELWLKLYHYDRIESDEVFDKLINFAIEKIENKVQFEHIGIFLHIISCLIFFSEEELISQKISMLTKIAEDYVQEISTIDEDRFLKKTLEISNFSPGIYFVQYKQLSFLDNNNLIFEEIKLNIAKKMRSIYNNQALKYIENILKEDYCKPSLVNTLAHWISRKNDDIEFFLPKEPFLAKIDVEKLCNYFVKISSSEQANVLYSIFDYFHFLYHCDEHRSSIVYDACFICEFLIVIEYKSIKAIQENNKINGHKTKKNLKKYLTVKKMHNLGAFVVYVIDCYISTIKQYERYIAHFPVIIKRINRFIEIVFFDQNADNS